LFLEAKNKIYEQKSVKACLRRKFMSDAKNNLKVENYAQLLEQIKNDIQQSQLRAALAVNKELILLYWRIGKELNEQIDREKWGSKIIDILANDVSRAFPDISGFSTRNIDYMRKFAKTYPDLNYAAAAAQLPWGHNMVIMDKIENSEQRLFYVQKCLENGWSRSVLTMWIESNLYGRQGKAITNFKTTLPDVDSDLAQQTLKDPYNFSFLTIAEKAKEQEIEQGLIDHIQNFLVELGTGFAFLGRQYHVQVSDKDFYIDLLFYHIELRCFIVVELKAGEFEPKDAGQLNFYLTTVDKQLRRKDDNPTIGLLLVKTKDNLIAEYALQDINKPMGIAGYATTLIDSLPKELKSSLPTIEEIEAEIERVTATTSHKK
jgi:predicted nuclease of restriction endonuclease-like (RecB) superfamily